MNISISKLGAFLFGIGEKHCEQHATILKTFEEIAVQQALNVDHIAENTKDLEEGRKEFKAVSKAIANINTDVALLAQKAQQRRNSHRGDKDVKDSED